MKLIVPITHSFSIHNSSYQYITHGVYCSINGLSIQTITINAEGFTGLSLCVCHGFQEYCESVFMNIYLYHITALLSSFNVRHCKSLPWKLHWVESTKVYSITELCHGKKLWRYMSVYAITVILAVKCKPIWYWSWLSVLIMATKQAGLGTNRRC